MESIVKSIENSQLRTNPFRHWLLKDVFTPDINRSLGELPVFPPEEYPQEDGRRCSVSNQLFFTDENCSRYEICSKIAKSFRSNEVIENLEATLDIRLKGSFLRIGYYVDKKGFWLEPHLDLNVKLLTMTVYLSKQYPIEELGTDLFDSDKKLVTTVPSEDSAGFIFIPGSDTWHGFEKKNILGFRKALIVNYVTDEWGNTNEITLPQI